MASCMTNTKRNLHGLQTRLSDPSRISHAVNRKTQKYSIFSKNKLIPSLPWWIETLWQGFNYKVIHQARSDVTYSWSSGKMEGRSFHSSETGKERHEPCSQCQRSNYWMADCSASAWGQKYRLLNLVVRFQLNEVNQKKFVLHYCAPVSISPHFLHSKWRKLFCLHKQWGVCSTQISPCSWRSSWAAAGLWGSGADTASRLDFCPPDKLWSL